MLHIRGIAEHCPVRRLRIARQRLGRWLIVGFQRTSNAHYWNQNEQRPYSGHTQPLEIHSYPLLPKDLKVFIR